MSGCFFVHARRVQQSSILTTPPMPALPLYLCGYEHVVSMIGTRLWGEFICTVLPGSRLNHIPSQEELWLISVSFQHRPICVCRPAVGNVVFQSPESSVSVSATSRATHTPSHVEADQRVQPHSAPLPAKVWANNRVTCKLGLCVTTLCLWTS